MDIEIEDNSQNQSLKDSKLIEKKYSEYHLQAEMAKKAIEDQEEREKDPFDKNMKDIDLGKKVKVMD